MALSQNDALLSLYDYDPEYTALTTEEKRLFHYCGALIMTFEIVYECHQKGYFKSGILFRREDSTWNDWARWLQELLRYSPIFRRTWEWSKNDYDAEFIAEVERLLVPSTSAPKVA